MTARPRLIGLQDAANLLGISTTYFREAAVKKKIYFQVVGGRKIFFYNEIIEFKKRREKQAKTDKRVKLRK